MASNSITIVTALTMLAHSVWGCCWHHAHNDLHSASCAAAHRDGDNSSAHFVHGRCSHTGFHHHAAAPSELAERSTSHPASPEEDGHRHTPCRQSRCTFVKTSAVSIAMLWADMAVVWPIAPEVPGQTAVVALRSETDEAGPPLSSQAMRALTQTWLL